MSKPGNMALRVKEDKTGIDLRLIQGDDNIIFSLNIKDAREFGKLLNQANRYLSVHGKVVKKKNKKRGDKNA